MWKLVKWSVIFQKQMRARQRREEEREAYLDGRYIRTIREACCSGIPDKTFLLFSDAAENVRTVLLPV